MHLHRLPAHHHHKPGHHKPAHHKPGHHKPGHHNPGHALPANYAHQPPWLWADAAFYADFSVLDAVSLNYAVIGAAALASGAVSAAPEIAGIRWDTAVNEFLVLFIMRAELPRKVGRAEARELLAALGRSTVLAHKASKHVKSATRLAKRTGHPLAVTAHAAVSATATVATGIAAMRAVERRQNPQAARYSMLPAAVRDRLWPDPEPNLTAPGLGAQLPDALDASLSWAELVGAEPRKAAAASWMTEVESSRWPILTGLRKAGVADAPATRQTLEKLRSASDVEACGLLAETYTQRRAATAAAICREVAVAAR